MIITVKPNLVIKKSAESWNVVQTFVTKKEDGTEGEREKITYHGTLTQALQKVVDMEMAEHDERTDTWNDFHLLLQKMHEVQAEMHMLAKRIETALVLQV